jgi:uncharacterized membrane protein
VEELFKRTPETISMVELTAALIVGYGAIEAVWRSAFAIIKRRSKAGQRKDIWLRFGVWLLLGLEFELAADDGDILWSARRRGGCA